MPPISKVSTSARKHSTLSILKYAGGKFNSRHELRPYVPSTVTSVCAPFFGAGHFEIMLASEGVKVYGYDVFEPLTNFWQVLLAQPQRLYDLVMERYYPAALEMHKETNKHFCELFKNEWTPLESAAAFYFLSRTAFGGMVLARSQTASQVAIDDFNACGYRIGRITDFHAPNLVVEHMDFRDSIPKHPDSLLFLDPPYTLANSKREVHAFKLKTPDASFDHEALADILKARDNWILCYDDSDIVRDLYQGYRIDAEDRCYSTRIDRKGKEVVIISHDLKSPHLGLW